MGLDEWEWMHIAIVPCIVPDPISSNFSVQADSGNVRHDHVE